MALADDPTGVAIQNALACAGSCATLQDEIASYLDLDPTATLGPSREDGGSEGDPLPAAP